MDNLKGIINLCVANDVTFTVTYAYLPDSIDETLTSVFLTIKTASPIDVLFGAKVDGFPLEAITSEGQPLSIEELYNRLTEYVITEVIERPSPKRKHFWD